ncbi:TPA: hypothetical protein GDO54_018502 [Pyxicephalus adspersus]|uniref:Uncharacterized protein n=1 Tax=Pyxicephalus adspersus TaxID=30357 RepID=A0AAV2ZF40_PYXAD|nr:TPA: hypothetical protein GDO54_018502 [Pyxicephalus adspersus]
MTCCLKKTLISFSPLVRPESVRTVLTSDYYKLIWDNPSDSVSLVLLHIISKWFQKIFCQIVTFLLLLWFLQTLTLTPYP